MASKTVKKIDIELLIKGSEQLSRLKGSFRDLLKTVNQADAELESARQSIIEYGKGANKSISVIRGQVSAFKALQDQAKIGGKVFKDLAVDISLLKKQLKQVEDQATRTEKALSFKTARGRFISQTPGALIGKIDQLRSSATAPAFDEKGNLNKEYIEQQQQLNTLTKVQIRLEERLALKIREGTTATVDNNNQNKTAAELLKKYGKEINTGTLTSARLSQRLRELKEDFQDLTVGSKDYAKALRSISFLENKIADPFKTSARKAQIRGRLGQQEAFGMFAGRDPVQSSIDRRERKRSRRYNGFSGGGLANQPLEASALFKNIAGISGSGRSAGIQMMGKSYEEVSADIRAATAASNGSISSLEKQRNAWTQLRNGLDPASDAFREVTKDIEKVDRALEKTSRSRRKFSPGKAAQVAGATISGGIFGGPEGFLGGAIGGAIGGVGGSFAGAALGAQIGGLRQEIGRYSEMSSEIDRLRLGLAGASNDFDEFVRANIATEKASERLLIPLRTSFKIMTQLRANTVELGISVEDTTKIFEGITASVFKTGGSLAEVEGAMRAVIQILSKGTPQAEELRGQLGERLPAAILDFAKFTKRTPDELADALKKSQVTLGEFVDFAKNKFDENGQYLDGMADNAAYAGLRYEKALERVQLTTGRAFQAAGSNLQDFASRFLNGVDKIINKALELGLLDKGPSFFVEQVISEEVTKADLEIKLLKKAAELSNLKSNFPVDAAFKLVGGDGLKQEVDAIEQALKNLALFDKQTKERADQQAKDEKDALDKSRGQSFLNAIDQKESAIAQARIQLEEQAANIRKQAIEQAGQIEQDFAKQRLDSERDIQDLRRQLSYAEEDIAFGAEEARAVAGGADPETFRVRKEIIELARQQKEDEISLDREFLDEETERAKAIETFKVNNAQAINDANRNYAKQIGKIQQDYARSVAKIVEEGTGRAGKRLELSAKIAAEFIKRGKAEAALGELGVLIDELGTPRMLPGVELDTAQYNAVMGQNQLFIQANDKIKEFSEQLSAIPSATTVAAPAISSIGVNIGDLTGSLNRSKAALEATRSQVRGLSKDLSQAELNKKIGEIFAAQGKPVFDRLRQAKGNAALQKQILRLREEGYSQDTARELISQENTAADALRNLDAVRDQAAEAGLDFSPGLYDNIAESIRRATEESRELALALENVSLGDKLRNEVVDSREQLAALTDPANQITSAATAIGTAFSDSFKSVIDGSATTQEALAGFFKNIASYFLDMAVQIIQKMITMYILNTVVGLLPGGGGGGDIFSDIGERGGLRMANGGVFAKNKIVPYAKGGIVNKPTMFAYANGGAGRFGLMGEAGPEAIMPLSRGSNGKLGVQASGGVGNVVVNVDASGSKAQGDGPKAKQLGSLIGSAVQAELVKQKRPGGLLAS